MNKPNLEPIADEPPPASFYWPLFDLMYREHRLSLLESEMDEIMIICERLLDVAKEQQAKRELESTK